jgi:hypothetical protein
MMSRGDAGLRGPEADSFRSRVMATPRQPAVTRTAERRGPAGAPGGGGTRVGVGSGSAELSPVRLAACVAMLELYRHAHDDVTRRMSLSKRNGRAYRDAADEQDRLMRAMEDTLDEVRGLMQGFGARLRGSGASAESAATAAQNVMQNTLRVVSLADPQDARALAWDAERWAIHGFEMAGVGPPEPARE